MAAGTSKKKVFRILVHSRKDVDYLSHGYCVDDFPFGENLHVGDIQIDPVLTTFAQMRLMLEYNSSGHMNRRSVLFQEALYIMGKLPNVYSREKQEKNKYLFGYFSSDNELPVLFTLSQELVPISTVLPKSFTYDLIIVPYSQIDPRETTAMEVINDSDTSS
eukprot:gene2238-4351_t